LRAHSVGASHIYHYWISHIIIIIIIIIISHSLFTFCINVMYVCVRTV
jgi:hypothetical protein